MLIHSHRVGRLTLLDWSLLAAGGLYGLGWILVLLVTQGDGNLGWQAWINPFSEFYLVHTTAAFLLIGGLLAGWYLLSRVFPISRTLNYSTRKTWRNRELLLSFWLMLVIAVLCQGMYCRAYGGYFGVLEYSRLIRSGLFSSIPNNFWSFLKPFAGLGMIAVYGFFGFWISGHRDKITAVGFGISFIFSVYLLYSWMGRMGFLLFCSTFILSKILTLRYNPRTMIVWGTVIFCGVLMAAYAISIGLGVKAADSLPEFLARELSFPFASFFAQLADREHLFRGFIDILVTPIYLLPSSWWAKWFEPVGQVNTAVIMGASKGMGGVTSAIPVDLLTLGLMQAHLLGVVLAGILFGLLLRILQHLIDSISLYGLRAVFEAYFVLKIAVFGMFYSQPNLIISSNFSIIAAAIVILVVIGTKKYFLTISNT